MRTSLLAYAIGITLALSPVSATAMKAISVQGLKSLTWEAQFKNEPVAEVLNTKVLLAYTGDDLTDILGSTGVFIADGETSTGMGGTYSTPAYHSMENSDISSALNPMDKADQKEAARKVAEMLHNDVTAGEPEPWEKTYGVVIGNRYQYQKILPEMLTNTPSAPEFGIPVNQIKSGVHRTPYLELEHATKTYNVSNDPEGKKGKFIKGAHRQSVSSGVIEIAAH